MLQRGRFHGRQRPGRGHERLPVAEALVGPVVPRRPPAAGRRRTTGRDARAAARRSSGTPRPAARTPAPATARSWTCPTPERLRRGPAARSEALAVFDQRRLQRGGVGHGGPPLTLDRERRRAGGHLGGRPRIAVAV